MGLRPKGKCRKQIASGFYQTTTGTRLGVRRPVYLFYYEGDKRPYEVVKVERHGFSRCRFKTLGEAQRVFDRWCARICHDGKYRPNQHRKTTL